MVEKKWYEVFEKRIQPMKLTFAVDFSRISIGEMTIEVLPRKSGFRTFNVHFETNDFYKFFYDLENKIESNLKIGSLEPIETKIYKKHGKKIINEKQKFSNLELIYNEHKVKKGKKESRENKIKLPENSKELLGMMFYSMYIPDDELNETKINLILKDKVYLVTVENFSKKVIKFKNNELKVREISFKSYKDGKSQKKGAFTISHTLGDSRILVSVVGHLKIGKLKSLLIKAE